MTSRVLELQARQGRYRFCATPDCTTRVYTGKQFCAACYAATAVGAADLSHRGRLLYAKRKEEARIAAGKPTPACHCSRCALWDHGCTIGIPEGIGTFAQDCAAFQLAMTADTTNPLHPATQDAVQGRLELAYATAGRHDPTHPFHSLYTDVFGELDAKGITLEPVGGA
jgi:hypothetical protein